MLISNRWLEVTIKRYIGGDEYTYTELELHTIRVNDEVDDLRAEVIERLKALKIELGHITSYRFV